MEYRWILAASAVFLIVRARCDGSDKEPIDLEGINALVPDELKGQLVFVERELVADDGRFGKITYTAAAPATWIPGYKGFAMLVHPDHKTHFFTHFHLGYNCDGVCEPKDWNAVIDKVYAYALKGDVIKNVKSPTSRTLIARDPSNGTVVLVAHWKQGASRYDSCDAYLENELHDFPAVALAFEKACEVVHRD